MAAKYSIVSRLLIVGSVTVLKYGRGCCLPVLVLVLVLVFVLVLVLVFVLSVSVSVSG